MIRQYSSLIAYGLFICVLLLAFGLRANQLDAYPPGISNDEAINGLDAFHFATTGTLPLYEESEGREPLFRIFQGFGLLSFGKTVYALRMVSVLVSLPFIASTMWVTREALRDYPRYIRILAAISAGLVIATMMGNIVISRSIYRGVIFYLAVSLSIGFMLRGLRRSRWIDFICCGFWGGLSLYTYTAAWFFPFSFFVLAFALLITRLSDWKTWLPQLIVTGVVAAIVCLPILYLLLVNPSAVFVRADSVSSSSTSLLDSLLAMNEVFLRSGDPNPQYNATIAPLVPKMISWFFYIGLIALIVRIRRAETWFLGSLLILMALPALLSNEINHGLRISGEFVIIPIIIGLGIGIVLWGLDRIVKRPIIVTSGAIIGLSLFALMNTTTTWQKYTAFYDNPGEWRLWNVHEMWLNHNEWFFRVDRQAFGEWVSAQDYPMLVPVEELNRQATRSWLMATYPETTSADSAFILPTDTQLVMPWSLELGDLMHSSSQYALLNDGVITLLPLFTEATLSQLNDEIESGNEIIRDGQIDFLGYVKPIDIDALEFVTPQITGEQLANFGNGDVILTGWSGDLTLEQDSVYPFTLEWVAQRRIGHSYISSIQLQTQDYERITGTDAYIMRWIYPTLAWDSGSSVSTLHTFDIPADLPAGAYRITTGLLYPNAPLVAVESNSNHILENRVTVDWLKIEQDQPDISDSAYPIEVAINEQFLLTHVEFAMGSDDILLGQLHWHGLVSRPSVDATIFVHIIDDAGQIIAQSDSRPLDGQYPTFIWDADEVIRTDHRFNFSDFDNLENYTIRIGMYTFPGPQNLPLNYQDRQYDDGLVILDSLNAYFTE